MANDVKENREYTVKTGDFEGPLSALLDMIERRKLDITRLSLASVADEFVAYVETSENVPMEVLADFLSIAAKLLLIKSRAILPVWDTPDEQEEEDAQDLEDRLREYKRFKEISLQVGEMFDSAQRAFPRDAYAGIDKRQFLDERIVPNIPSERLRQIFRDLLAAIPDPEALRKRAIRQIVSVEETIRSVRRLLEKRKRETFFACVEGNASPENISVTFLAVLELVRSETISAQQNQQFGDIDLRFVESKGR
jgi:segregation and condensation protein A